MINPAIYILVKIKHCIYFLIFYSGFVYILRYIYRKLYANPVKILFTHRIIDPTSDLSSFLENLGYLSIEEFEKKIKYLVGHYKFISLDDYVKNMHLPVRLKNCIVLTFDDGYRCLYTKIYPVLRKYAIPSTVFITTSSMTTKSLLWFDRLLYFLGKTDVAELLVPEISRLPYKLVSLKEKSLAYNDICAYLKKINNAEKEAILERVLKALKINDSKHDSDWMLTREMMLEMQQSGLVSFGAHSVNHPILTKVSLEEAEYEIRRSKEILEDALGKNVDFFAYPNGDYNSMIQSLVKGCGYKCALTAYEENDETQFSKLSLGRNGFDREPHYLFGLKVNGVFNLNIYARKLLRNAGCWLPGYVINRLNVISKRNSHKPVHIFLAICDHFEPLNEGATKEEGLERVKKWVEAYPKIAQRHKDHEGFFPKHTFFYPAEEYHQEYLDSLEKICHDGYSELEIHLHHDNDTGESLRRTLLHFRNLLFSEHHLLSRRKDTNEITYGFIHGNWSLNNSRRDGRWCGVNNELEILKQTGCYADFTMPSAPSDTQTQKVNSIYYAIDNFGKPKSHNWGIDAERGSNARKGLLMIQGPLHLSWGKRKMLVLPTIENGTLSAHNPISAHRVKLWVDSNISVKGMTDWRFLKLHTHGCQEDNLPFLLSNGLDSLFSHLEEKYNDGKNYILHYVSAREMANIITAIEDDCTDKDIATLKNYRYVCNGKLP